MPERPEPYIRRDPSDLIRARDWNEVQISTREDVQGHDHTGGEEGVQVPRGGIQPGAIDGSRIDPEATVTVKELSATAALRAASLSLGAPPDDPGGVVIDEISTDGTLAGNRDSAVPTERAVKEYVDELLVGAVMAFAMQAPPAGWLECNGQAVRRAEYKRLFDRIGVMHGAGNGVTTFNLPDLRGVVAKGWDGTTAFGSKQVDAFESHVHAIPEGATEAAGGHGHGVAVWIGYGLLGGTAVEVGGHPHSVNLGDTGTPKSTTGRSAMPLLYCIKY